MVMDWGIAKHVASTDRQTPEPSVVPGLVATRVGALVGTPSYMSPEQAWGKNDALDPRSDLYSATALLHELLTLEHYLGSRATPEEMLVAVSLEEVSLQQLFERRAPRQPAPPLELLRFVAKGVAKEPDERFQSAEEMIEALQGILEARAIVQRHLAPARRQLRTLRLLGAALLNLTLYAVLSIASRIRTALSSPASDVPALPAPGN
jgi:serine/threonine-protein kinase